MHTCPICGFDKLLYPIEENPVCPSCYTEFGFDDEMKTFEELRDDWIKDGMPWRGINVQLPPINWNPYVQLANLENDVYSEAVTVTRTFIDDSKKEVNNPAMDVYFRGYWQLISYTVETRTVGA